MNLRGPHPDLDCHLLQETREIQERAIAESRDTALKMDTIIDELESLGKDSLQWLRHIGWGAAIVYVAGLIALFVGRVISRKSIAPMKPFVTVVLDTLLEIPYLLNVGPWGKPNTIMQAMETAMSETRLTDFGHDGQPQMSRSDSLGFVNRYETSQSSGLGKCKGRYSPLGYLLSFNTLKRRMVVRLRHVEYIKNHPQVSKIPVLKPVFVIGFPRTGTTFLHEMLTLNKKVKTHYTWEQCDHVPATQQETCSALREDRVKRYRGNRGDFDRKLHLVGDDIQAIHRIGYDEPEECTTPCALELPYAIGALPLYILAADEVIPLGCGKAFSFYKEYLQMLTWQSGGERIERQVGVKDFQAVSSTEEARIDKEMANAPGKLGKDHRWMLKCPFHLPYLEELFETFPDATVVWTHRDPVECIGSACSLYYTLAVMALEVDSIDKKAIGQGVVDYTKTSLDRAEASLRKLEKKGASIIHIRYQDNVQDPSGTVTGILKQTGIIESSQDEQEYKEELAAYLTRNKATNDKVKSKKGGHTYSLADYGLDEAGVRATFKPYTDKYDLVEAKRRK